MGEGFAAALESGDLGAVRAFPKADLHNHGVLCGDREFLRETTGVDVAPLAQPIGSMDEMGAWVDANIGPLLYRKGGRLLLYEAAFRLALRDGVTRIRMGDDVNILREPRDSPLRVLSSLQAIHQRVAPE